MKYNSVAYRIVGVVASCGKHWLLANFGKLCVLLVCLHCCEM